MTIEPDEYVQKLRNTICATGLLIPIPTILNQ